MSIQTFLQHYLDALAFASSYHSTYIVKNRPQVRNYSFVHTFTRTSYCSLELDSFTMHLTTHLSMLFGILITTNIASPTPISATSIEFPSPQPPHQNSTLTPREIIPTVWVDHLHYDDIQWNTPECGPGDRKLGVPRRDFIAEGGRKLQTQYNKKGLCIGPGKGSCKDINCNYGSTITFCTDEGNEVCLDDSKPLADAVEKLLTCHADYPDGRKDRAVGVVYSMDRKINVVIQMRDDVKKKC